MVPVSARSVVLSKVLVQNLASPMMAAPSCSRSGKGQGIATLLALPSGPQSPSPIQGLGEGLGGAGWVVFFLRLPLPQVSHSGELLRPELLLHQLFGASQTHEEEEAPGVPEPIRGGVRARGHGRKRAVGRKEGTERPYLNSNYRLH